MLEGTSPDVPKIFGSAGALPSRKFAVSPFATRYSPSFWLGRSLALPLHSVPRPTPLVPRPVLTGGYENKACEAG